MGRPAKQDKRDRQLNLKLTLREFAWVAKEATAIGMRPGEYGRAKVLADRPVAAAAVESIGPHRDPLFLAHLARIGNNLNQIARKLHAFNVPAPEEIVPLLRMVREALRRASSDR